MKKVLLRRRFAEGIERANIYLAGCGRGDMFRSTWMQKAGYVLALDSDAAKVSYVKYHFPAVDARVGDFNTFSEWPAGVQFQIADFDPYGNPYDAVENFFEEPRCQLPVQVFVTDGTPLWLGRGGVLPKQFHCEDAPCRVYDRDLRQSYFDALVWPWWSDLAHRRGLRLTRAVLLWKRYKGVAYYAVQLED